jgi:transcriptional regulator GlxA family with amidase domain
VGAGAKTRTLGAVLYPDFELLDLYGPLEMFGNVGPELRIVTVAEQRGPVASAQGPQTLAEHAFDEAPELDLLLVPGGIGTFPQLEGTGLVGFLQERAKRAEVSMSVCSGASLLAKAGLLDGRRATTNKQFFDLCAQQGPKVDWIREARWVEDGPMATSSGVSAGTDMSLSVIARLYGRERADGIAALAEYEWQDDPARDPFLRYLNQGDLGALAATFQRDEASEAAGD